MANAGGKRGPGVGGSLGERRILGEGLSTSEYNLGHGGKWARLRC